MRENAQIGILSYTEDGDGIYLLIYMFKIPRYFMEHSTCHMHTSSKPMSPNKYHYYDV